MKPNLMLPSAARGVAVNAGQTAAAALIHLNSTGNYYRKGSLVVRKILDKDGENNLVPMTPPILQTVLFDEMTVMQWPGRSNAPIPVASTEIKDPTLKTILGGIYVERHLRSITVVARTPYLVFVNGELVQLKRGYNPVRGGIYVTGESEPVEVSIDEAATSLAALFCDFNFATPSDKSRAIAAVLCAVLRLAGVFERSPFLAYEADESQAGKTKLWNMTTAIVGQRYGNVVPKKGGVGSLDEQIMERLVDGYTCILLDNMRGKLDSPYFESCLTPEAGDNSARIAGVRSSDVDPRPVLFGLTSNGVELTRDAANRGLMTRIRKRPGDYQFRIWTDASGKPVGVREHIQSRQAYYHSCANSIVLHWKKNGAQQIPCTEHDFRECVGALDFMVRTYFKLPPLLDGHQSALDRTTKPGLSWVRTIALKAASEWYVVDWTASKIAERCIQDGVGIPGVTGEVETKVAAQQIGLAMASAFGSDNRIVIDGVVVTRTSEKDGHGGVLKLYSFTKASQ